MTQLYGARRKRPVLRAVLLAIAVAVAAVGGAIGYSVSQLRKTVFATAAAPESPTGLRPVPERRFAKAAVVAAHPEAARLGAEVLASGGSAIDAAVAVQAALTLVEPQSSGIGGGAFLLYFDGPSGTLSAFDGRETAPKAATPKRFLGADGKPVSFPQAMLGGRSVGVPGVLRMLELAHRRYGHKTWAELFAGPTALAEHGFAVTPRLRALLSVDPVLPALPQTRAYFFGADGWPRAVGFKLANPALAETFRAIGSGGADAFYTGPIARDIVAAVQGGHRPSLGRAGFNLVARQLGIAASGAADVDASGDMTLEDLRDYRALDREPLCVPYRQYRVCSLPPPSGGASLLQLMALLESTPLPAMRAGSPEEAHALVNAEAVMDADRDRWIADPAFAAVPTEGLLDPSYVAERRKLLSAERAVANVPAGMPPGATAAAERGEGFEVPSTSHFVVADDQGSIACVTTSIEFGFGSHLFVRGFLLNNQLTDFAFAPEANGRPVFNAVQAGKRPRSAMSPVIVFDERTGRPVLALGSPGGPRIIGYVAQALVGVLDHGLLPTQAIAQPHVVYGRGSAEVEDMGWPSSEAQKTLIQALEAKGHKVSVTAQNSGVHALWIGQDGVVAGIDPRREGDAFGR